MKKQVDDHPRDEFEFRADVWLYPSVQAAWHFITVPKRLSATIKKTFGAKAKHWGSIPVLATIGKTSWKTSVFPDTKRNAYILPLKAKVRKAENITKGDRVVVTLNMKPFPYGVLECGA